MSGTNVSFEIVSLVAAVGTVGAGVGLLPCVGPLVPLQFVASLEGLVANDAHVTSVTCCRCG